MCAWLGLSRTPVRDALSRLRDDGLVEMAAQRFTRVAAVSAQDVHEVVPLLAAVHALATESAVPRLTQEDIGRLRMRNEEFFLALRKRDRPGAYRADEAFHDVFVERSGIGEIARVLARLTPRLHRIECFGQGELPGGRSVGQHQAIITRAQSGDAEGAASIARANWMTLGTVLARALARGVPG